MKTQNLTKAYKLY